MNKSYIALPLVFICGVCFAWGQFSFNARLNSPRSDFKDVEKGSYYTEKEYSVSSILEMELRNMGTSKNTFIIDFYFARKPLSENYYELVDWGSVTLTLNPMQLVKIPRPSRPVSKKVLKYSDGSGETWGYKIGGFIAILKDKDGKVLNIQASPNKLKHITSKPDKLADFLSDTNNIEPYDPRKEIKIEIKVSTNQPSSLSEKSESKDQNKNMAPMSPMMPQQEGYIRVKIEDK